jgi:hypothetical protein
MYPEPMQDCYYQQRVLAASFERQHTHKEVARELD